MKKPVSVSQVTKILPKCHLINNDQYENSTWAYQKKDKPLLDRALGDYSNHALLEFQKAFRTLDNDIYRCQYSQ
jgi:hypothetical protein